MCFLWILLLFSLSLHALHLKVKSYQNFSLVKFTLNHEFNIEHITADLMASFTAIKSIYWTVKIL